MKRKKKKNTQQIKQQSRQHQNEFYKKLRSVFALIGDVSALNMLDKPQIVHLYKCRIRPYKFVSRNGYKVEGKTLEALNKSLCKMLQNNFYELGPQKMKISLYDFTVYIETLHLFWRNLDSLFPEIADKFKACIPLFDDKFQDVRVDVLALVQQKMRIVFWLFSDPSRQLLCYIPENEVEDLSVDSSPFWNNYLVENRKPETETVNLDGNIRKVIRLTATIDQSFVPLEITPEKLGIEGIMSTYPLKVYIQPHAFDRLEQRLGKLFRTYCYLYIIAPILACQPVKAVGSKGYLFPVTHGKIKFGYLKADIFGDKLVIRTFLFLTNNGTPEGKKLQELLGLQKADKKYLHIDKLSTFVNSDIRKDQNLKAIFSEAGCGDLLILDKSFLDASEDKDITCARFVSHYLGIDDLEISQT